MKRISLIILLFFILISKSNAYAFENEKYLDIKLSKTLAYNDYLELNNENGLSIYNKNDKSYPLLNLQEKNVKVTVDKIGNVNILNSNNSIIYSFNAAEDIIIGSSLNIEPEISIDNSKYRGYIRFLLKDENIFLINHVELEDYLYGVVPKEVPYSWPEETLKAQAVASRSFAISNMNKHIKEGYNLCDTTDCQVYGGMVAEQKTTTEAIDNTRGVFVFYDNKIIEAIFHSTSGGYTEDSKNVWGGDMPYLKSVKDIYSKNSPHSNWTTTIKLSEIQDNLYANGINIGKIEKIEIIDTLHTNRVNKVRLKGSLGEEVVSGSKFRSLLGNTFLKSSYFTIEGAGLSSNTTIYVMDGKMLEPEKLTTEEVTVLSANSTTKVSRSNVNRFKGENKTTTVEKNYSIANDEIVLNGSGYGHGVGMSQYGAMEMGKLGYSYEEILKFYYTDVEVRKEY